MKVACRGFVGWSLKQVMKNMADSAGGSAEAHRRSVSIGMCPVGGSLCLLR